MAREDTSSVCPENLLVAKALLAHNDCDISVSCQTFPVDIRVLFAAMLHPNTRNSMAVIVVLVVLVVSVSP